MWWSMSLAKKHKLWGDEGFEKICDITRHLINELRRQAPKVKEIIESGLISIDELNYPDYNNGCEIIP